MLNLKTIRVIFNRFLKYIKDHFNLKERVQKNDMMMEVQEEVINQHVHLHNRIKDHLDFLNKQEDHKHNS